MQANTCRSRPVAALAPLVAVGGGPWACIGCSGALSRTRHLYRPAKTAAGSPSRTTVALEPEFWAAIEALAQRRGLTWRDWVEIELAGKPEHRGAATWLRVRCLTDYIMEV